MTAETNHRNGPDPIPVSVPVPKGKRGNGKARSFPKRGETGNGNRLGFPWKELKMTKFFEPTIAMQLIMRHKMNNHMRLLMEHNHVEEYGEMKHEYDELGVEIRRRLREYGYEEYIEIDVEMEEMARQGWPKCDDLHWYILANSPTFATQAANLGILDLKVWQDGKQARRESEIARCHIEAEAAERRYWAEQARKP